LIGNKMGIENGGRPNTKSNTELEKNVGLLSATALIVGTMIGKFCSIYVYFS
jgi:hypothetical protein